MTKIWNDEELSSKDTDKTSYNYLFQKSWRIIESERYAGLAEDDSTVESIEQTCGDAEVHKAETPRVDIAHERKMS